MFEKIAKSLFGWCYPFLKSLGFDRDVNLIISLILNTILLCVFSYVIYLIFRFILVTTMAVVAKKTKTKFDDLLVSNQTAKYIAHLIPLLFIYRAVPVILDNFTYWENIFGKLVGIYIIMLSLWITRTVFNALKDHLKENPTFSDKPIDSYIQVIMIVLWSFAVIAIILYIFDTSVRSLLTVFGTISALIVLIFRDTILGFVASIQVTINDMVRIGDWITMDKFGADGDVIEINLATVKVRNFDYTTTTIPTYSLISDSFRNWRGMLGSDGRRIKRHILIRPSTIRFLNENELEKLKQIELITDYITNKKIELSKFNESHHIDKSLAINGRNITNFGLFRKYINEYLKQYPGLNKDMVMICRQLQPTPHGLPLEIYCFSHDQRFEEYEYIMADVFDHVLASIIYFDLEIYEVGAKA